jgi:hypothetical protein
MDLLLTALTAFGTFVLGVVTILLQIVAVLLIFVALTKVLEVPKVIADAVSYIQSYWSCPEPQTGATPSIPGIAHAKSQPAVAAGPLATAADFMREVKGYTDQFCNP